MIVALLGVLVLGALAVFQALLVAGAPLGRLAWGGQHEVLPLRLRIGSTVSIVVYAATALLMLHAAGAISVLSAGFVDTATWVLVGFFGLGIVMNVVSRSRPERLVMTPVVLLLTAVCLILALN